MAEGNDGDFSVAGVATVRWDGPHSTVFVERDGWAVRHLRERLEKVPQSVMEIAYFASVEEARGWLAR